MPYDYSPGVNALLPSLRKWQKDVVDADHLTASLVCMRLGLSEIAAQSRSRLPQSRYSSFARAEEESCSTNAAGPSIG